MTVRTALRLMATVWAAGLFGPAAGAWDNTKVVRKGASGRSAYADLRGKAHLKIPAGFGYVSGEDLVELRKDVNFPVPEWAVGVLYPEDGDWAVTLSATGEDPFGGIARDEVAAKAEGLLAKVRAAVDAANPARTASGRSAFRVTGWTHKPQYDPIANRVTWGYRLTDDDDDNDLLVYETVLFGPDGNSVAITLVADLSSYQIPLSEYRKVVESARFGSPPGLEWLSLSGVAGNETALFIGAVVMVMIGGGGLMLRQTTGDRRKVAPPPRSW